MKKFIFMAFIAVFTCSAIAQNKNASVREDVLRLTTYPFGDPNPVAQPENKMYPYFSFDKYTAKGETKEWQAVILENDYIQVTVVPSIGGKVWGAVEKTTGKPFLYFNHAAKFRQIAMRGPWSSGGLEANFGIIGHAPTTVTPVDYCIRQNSDNSVSCFIDSL
jgi:hypothetical protein